MANDLENIRYHDKQQRKYSAKIKDLSLPIESFIGDLLRWMERPNCSYEPYARCLREAIDIGRNGYGADIDKIKEYLPRLEAIAQIAKQRGSPFSKMILHESVAHRYADIWIKEKAIELESQMIAAYHFAFKMAIKGKYLKNQDSAPYWLAKAYEKAGEFEKAYVHYKFLLERKGARFKQASHAQKINEARVFVNQNKSRFKSTNHVPFSIPNA